MFSLRSSRYRDLSHHRAASWKEFPTALGKISPPLLPLNHLKLLFLRQDYQQVVAKFHGTFRSNKLPLALQATPRGCEAAALIRWERVGARGKRFD